MAQLIKLPFILKNQVAKVCKQQQNFLFFLPVLIRFI